jgi:hypothetical protein
VNLDTSGTFVDPDDNASSCLHGTLFEGIGIQINRPRVIINAPDSPLHSRPGYE